jgi:Flp pilus assembly protein TadD
MTLRRALNFALCCVAALSLAACGRGGRQNANRAGANNPASSTTNASVPPQEALASGQLDAEIARLEAQAEKNPEDDTARASVAAAYVRRANALREAGRADDALRDYQTALRFNPDNEEAQLGLEQINQEAGAEPRADDGRPVTVPAKKQ